MLASLQLESNQIRITKIGRTIYMLGAHELEIQFQEWNNDASMAIGFQKGSRIDDSSLLEVTAHDTYPGIWTASVWNKCRALRILVHQTLLENSLETSPCPSKDGILRSEFA
jgi:hypothetical protein